MCVDYPAANSDSSSTLHQSQDVTQFGSSEGVGHCPRIEKLVVFLTHVGLMSAYLIIISPTYLRIPRSLVFTITKLLISEADVAPMRAHDGDGVLQWSNRYLN